MNEPMASAAVNEASPWSAMGLARWQPYWQARAPRERAMVIVAAAAVVLLVLWWLAIAPALATLRAAPAQLDALDVQLQEMQQLAAEARSLRATPPISTEQALAALKAAQERHGEKMRLVLQGDRATITLANLPAAALREWLQEVRTSARVRPIEATLTRSPQGFSGSLVIVLPSAGGAK